MNENENINVNENENVNENVNENENDVQSTNVNDVQSTNVNENVDDTQSANENNDEVLLAEAQKKIEELQDKVLRMQAEFDNYRKRTAREKADLYTTAGERIFKDMLPLIDDFERAEAAMATSEDIEALRQGMDLIYKKFLSFLEKNDVKPIPAAQGDAFDVDRHEAITTFAAGEELKGKVFDCTQHGYTLGEKVIRYAKVVVGA